MTHTNERPKEESEPRWNGPSSIVSLPPRMIEGPCSEQGRWGARLLFERRIKPDSLPARSLRVAIQLAALQIGRNDQVNLVQSPERIYWQPIGPWCRSYSDFLIYTKPGEPVHTTSLWQEQSGSLPSRSKATKLGKDEPSKCGWKRSR